MAENPENKEDKPDLFSPSGEALGYISLEQARVLAIRHARDNTDFYGPRYSGINLVLEVISQEDGEEYYDIRLSFRPAGRFRGEPGVEQFVIDKLGNIEYRQMLDEPTGLDLPETEQESPVSQPPPTPPQPTDAPPPDGPAIEPEPTVIPPPTNDVAAPPEVAPPQVAPPSSQEAPPERASGRPARSTLRGLLAVFAGLAVVAVVVIGVFVATSRTPAPVEPVIIEKEVIKEVPVEVIVEKEVIKEVLVEKEVIKEVPVEVIVEREVIKEVVREVVVVTTPQPTAPPPPPPLPPPSLLSFLDITTVGDSLQFDKRKLTAQAGKLVVITFKNASTVNQHNFVVVREGTKDEVAAAGTGAGPDNGWLPPGDDRVLAHTGLLDPGLTEELRFTAPPPGNYQFVCTFPGHNFTMFGAFGVTR